MKLQDLKTFEDACKVERLDPKKVIPTFAGFPAKDRKAMIAHAKLVIIARAANRLGNKGKAWKPDWNNGQWDKYYPWFLMKGGSSGFRFADCAYWLSRSDVGSRLCFIDYNTMKHVVDNFLGLYKIYYTK